MAKKVKVVYDVEGKMKKKKNKKGSSEYLYRFGKGNVIALVVLFVLEALFYYFATPPINIHCAGFWVWMIITVAAIGLCTVDFSRNGINIHKLSDGTKQYEGMGRITMICFLSALACVIVLIVGGISSCTLFQARKYADVLEIQNGDFNTDITMNENISTIALMDTDTARIIGERAIGSLSDVVSQYEVSEEYSTIDFNGKPMKVAPLEYAGLIKYFNNKKDGIPGYVLVDPVKNEAKYVELVKPMKYSTSAYFNNNIERHVQLSYPTKQFQGFYFEIDNEGNPYYICPVLKPKAGLMGAKDVTGVVICDPCSGDCSYMDVADVPNWVDRVYDGDLACKKYNWYGTLSGGFWNSVFGNKGCKKTTDDYGYKVMNGDVYVYTGVTSVNGDQSNIGFVMMNSRTGEAKYFNVAGAEEHSAMSSAEGQVQNLGYKASFPTLINVDGVPTYIMVLKDNAGLVKMYGLVNMEKYNIVATAATEREAINQYRKLLASNGIATITQGVADDTPSKTIIVKDIQYITMGGETYVYITSSTGDVFKSNFADDETLIFIQPENTIKIFYGEGENNIKTIISYEFVN